MTGLELYERVRAVPKEAQKAFNNGSFSGTDINPMWRIKALTEAFGACGVGWYYEVLSERSEVLDDSTTIAIVDLNLYIKADGEWSKPIYGTGGNKLRYNTKRGIVTSDEGYKMALTDALSVACKALGVGADVYWDKDKTKYTASQVADEPVCECCTKPITAYKGYSKDAVIAMAKEHYSKSLCWSCMVAAKQAITKEESNA